MPQAGFEHAIPVIERSKTVRALDRAATGTGYIFKVKVKLSLCFKLSTTPWRRIGEWRYSSTHSLTSALDGGECSASRPGRLYPRGKRPWYPLDRRLGGPQSRSGRGGEEKNSQLLLGLEPRNHPIRIRALYHWAISAPNGSGSEQKKIPVHIGNRTAVVQPVVSLHTHSVNADDIIAV
jgi:hypothetical protein